MYHFQVVMVTLLLSVERSYQATITVSCCLLLLDTTRWEWWDWVRRKKLLAGQLVWNLNWALFLGLVSLLVWHSRCLSGGFTYRWPKEKNLFMLMLNVGLAVSSGSCPELLLRITWVARHSQTRELYCCHNLFKFQCERKSDIWLNKDWWPPNAQPWPDFPRCLLTISTVTRISQRPFGSMENEVQMTCLMLLRPWEDEDFRNGLFIMEGLFSFLCEM